MIRALHSTESRTDPEASSAGGRTLMAVAKSMGFQEAQDALVFAGASKVQEPVNPLPLSTAAEGTVAGAELQVEDAPSHVYLNEEVPFSFYRHVNLGDHRTVEIVRAKTEPALVYQAPCTHQRTRQSQSIY